MNRVFYGVRMPKFFLPFAFYQLLTIDVVDAGRDTPILVHISRSPTYKDSHHRPDWLGQSHLSLRYLWSTFDSRGCGGSNRALASAALDGLARTGLKYNGA